MSHQGVFKSWESGSLSEHLRFIQIDKEISKAKFEIIEQSRFSYNTKFVFGGMSLFLHTFFFKCSWTKMGTGDPTPPKAR